MEVIKINVKLSKGVRIRPEEFGGIIQTGEGRVLEVDSIGFEILSYIKDGSEIGQIIKNMQEKFEGDPEKIEGDILKFTQDLMDRGVIQVEEH